VIAAILSGAWAGRCFNSRDAVSFDSFQLCETQLLPAPSDRRLRVWISIGHPCRREVEDVQSRAAWPTSLSQPWSVHHSHSRAASNERAAPQSSTRAMARAISFRHLGAPQLARLLPSPRIQGRQRSLPSGQGLPRAWWESTSTTDVPQQIPEETLRNLMKSLWVSASTASNCSDLSAFTYNLFILHVCVSQHLANSRPQTRCIMQQLTYEHAYSWTMTERNFRSKKIYFCFFRGLEIFSKSGQKWLTPNDLIEFSGFSGISIDFPENQDIEQQGLTMKFDRHFQLYLVCSPDLCSWFYFRRNNSDRTVRVARRLPTHNRSSYRSSFSITNPHVVAHARRHAPRKSNIAGVR